MIILIVLVLFFIVMFLGLPISISLLAASILYCFMTGNVGFLYSIPMKMISGMNNFTFLAIPMFMLAGEIMNRGGITDAIMDFCDQLVGHFRGGLGYVNAVASTIFGGITGSALTDVTCLGAIEIPAMEKNGYDKEYSCAITVASAIQGPIIPPSIQMVTLAGLTGISTGALLLGGAVPGVLLGVSCCAVNFIMSRKHNYPKSDTKFNLRHFIRVLGKTFFPIMTPVVLIGGMVSGYFTPTEAAAISVLYALLVSTLIFHSLTWKSIGEAIKNSALASVKVYYIQGAATVFSWILSIENIPNLLSNFFRQFSGGYYGTLVLMVIFLLIWGMFMDTIPAMYIIVPLFYPIASSVGINSTHFGVVVVLTLMIGLMTPPYGVALYACQAISGVKLTGLLKKLIPFYIGTIAVLVLVMFIPQLVTALPHLFGLGQ